MGDIKKGPWAELTELKVMQEEMNRRLDHLTASAEFWRERNSFLQGQVARQQKTIEELAMKMRQLEEPQLPDCSLNDTTDEFSEWDLITDSVNQIHSIDERVQTIEDILCGEKWDNTEAIYSEHAQYHGLVDRISDLENSVGYLNTHARED